MKNFFLGVLAGLIWFYAFSLALAPAYDYRGFWPAVGCIFGGMVLCSIGCTVAMLADGKKKKVRPPRDDK